MAGREFSGFDYSLSTLFENASLIITPNKNTDESVVALIKSLADELSFKKIVVTTPSMSMTELFHIPLSLHILFQVHI